MSNKSIHFSKRAKASWHSLLGSTSLLIVVFVVCIDLFLHLARPLRYFNESGFTSIDQNPLVAKLPDYLQSQDNANILLLGSSLTLTTAVRCDDELAGVPTRYDLAYDIGHISSYEKAEYLRQAISKRLGQSVSLRNLSVVASMASDYELIVEKIIESGKKPLLIICCVAPRDFYDNERTNVAKTPTYRVLTNLGDLRTWLQISNIKDFSQRTIENIWQFYRMRTSYKTLITGLTAQSWNRPITLYEYSQIQLLKAKPQLSNHQNSTPLPLDKAEYQQPANSLSDLPSYKRRYQPANIKLFAEQEHYFKQMLALCKINNIALIIANMPLTKENKNLLEASALQQYKNLLKESATQFKAEYIDADNNSIFTTEDFEDSCHLNAHGGKAFFNMLADKVCSFDQPKAKVDFTKAN